METGWSMGLGRACEQWRRWVRQGGGCGCGMGTEWGGVGHGDGWGIWTVEKIGRTRG